MKHTKPNWKIPAIIVLAVILLCQSIDLVRLIYFDGSCRLPVLMYHHFEEESTKDTVVSSARFREQITAMAEAGYHAVTIPQVIDYVEQGVPLPKKPVLITMDDGYTSNLTIAGPVLEEMGMCATVFVIGANEGETAYIHSGEPFWQARFSYEEAAPWVEKGVIDLQSHTFDMHQLASYGFSGRDGVLRMDGESDEAYRQAIAEDSRLFKERRGDRVSTPLLALAYPFGYYDAQADELLEEEGYVVTFTIDDRPNRLFPHDERCLRMLGRINVTDYLSGEALVKRLDRYFAGAFQ